MAQPPEMAHRLRTRSTRSRSTPTAGQIVMDLDPGLAPVTVNHFVVQARNGFYDGLTFHRVVPGFVIQGGDPDGTRPRRSRLQVRRRAGPGRVHARRGGHGQRRPGHQRLAVLHLHRRLPRQAPAALQPVRPRDLGCRRRPVRPGRRQDQIGHRQRAAPAERLGSPSGRSQREHRAGRHLPARPFVTCSDTAVGDRDRRVVTPAVGLRLIRARRAGRAEPRPSRRAADEVAPSHDHRRVVAAGEHLGPHHHVRPVSCRRRAARGRPARRPIPASPRLCPRRRSPGGRAGPAPREVPGVRIAGGARQRSTPIPSSSRPRGVVAAPVDRGVAGVRPRTTAGRGGRRPSDAGPSTNDACSAQKYRWGTAGAVDDLERRPTLRQRSLARKAEPAEVERRGPVRRRREAAGPRGAAEDARPAGPEPTPWGAHADPRSWAGAAIATVANVARRAPMRSTGCPCRLAPSALRPSRSTCAAPSARSGGVGTIPRSGSPPTPAGGPPAPATARPRSASAWSAARSTRRPGAPAPTASSTACPGLIGLDDDRPADFAPPTRSSHGCTASLPGMRIGRTDAVVEALVPSHPGAEGDRPRGPAGPSRDRAALRPTSARTGRSPPAAGSRGAGEPLRTSTCTCSASRRKRADAVRRVGAEVRRSTRCPRCRAAGRPDAG